MEFNRFGNTDLEVSKVGFGAWAIGGAAKVGEVAIGWGETDDRESIKALKKAMDLGINFYDTADFYGRGHSEELIGKTFGNRQDVIIASKGGHRVSPLQEIYTDYSSIYIKTAVEKSLKRLKRETIDFYQLHSAKVSDLENEELTSMLDRLVKEGKIRYYGVSLNTFSPQDEGNFVFENNWGSGLQVVFNLINRKAEEIIQQAKKEGLGIIARMPLQFGLLAGRFDGSEVFEKTDHRGTRLPSNFVKKVNNATEDFWKLASDMDISKAEFSLRWITSYPGVSTVIPGIRTPDQAIKNAKGAKAIPSDIMKEIDDIYHENIITLWEDIVNAG